MVNIWLSYSHDDKPEFTSSSAKYAGKTRLQQPPPQKKMVLVAKDCQVGHTHELKASAVHPCCTAKHLSQPGQATAWLARDLSRVHICVGMQTPFVLPTNG